MGQIEVYEWLKNLRLSGEDKFFTIKEVKEGMRHAGLNNNESNTGSNLLSLKMYGYLETKMTDNYRDWRMKFRLKKKYVKNKKS